MLAQVAGEIGIRKKPSAKMPAAFALRPIILESHPSLIFDTFLRFDFTFECFCDAVGGELLRWHVAQLIVYGAEIARSESRHALDVLGAAEFREERIPDHFDPFAGEIVELDLDGEPATRCIVETSVEICRGNKNAVEIFHLRQQFVDLLHFKIALGVVAVVEKTIRFVEEENRLALFGFAERCLDVCFGFADVLSEQIACSLDDQIPVQTAGEIPYEFGLAGTRSAVQENV